MYAPNKVCQFHLASTYRQPGAGKWGDFDYGRSGNPTRSNLQETLASLEGGCGALAFSSGMSAIHAVTMLLKTGDHVVAGCDLYGGAYRLLHKICNRAGIDVTLVELTDPDAVERGMTPMRDPRSGCHWMSWPVSAMRSRSNTAG